MEACDRLGGFLLLQSMAGGTGSGVGAFAAEALRDLYPSSFIASHCVWPYESGEVIVQSYNTLLTLAALVDAADAVVLVHNQARTGGQNNDGSELSLGRRFAASRCSASNAKRETHNKSRRRAFVRRDRCCT